MSRRVICAFVFGVLGVLILGAGVPAGAAPAGVQEKKVEIGEAQNRLQEIQTKASVSYENYDSALLGLNKLDEKIDGSRRDLSQAEDRMAEAQKNLEEAATQVYKSGNVGFIDVLVGSEDFSEFASRLELWVRLLAEERSRFEVVREARNNLQAEQAKLQGQRDDRIAALKTAVKEKDQAESAASDAEEYLQSLSGDLRAEIKAAAARRAENAQAAVEAALEDVKPAPAETAPSETASAEPASAETAPAPEMVQLAQVAPKASRADLRAEREAAEQRAADRAEKRAAAEAAAKEAERQAELAAKEARKQEAAQQQAARKRAEERRAEAEAARQAAKEAAIEQAAADRAAELAAQREAAKKAAEEQAAKQAASEQAAADQVAAQQAAAQQAAAQQAAADQAAAEQAAAEQTTVETTAPETTAPEATTPETTVPETTAPAPAPAPQPAPTPAPTTGGGGSCGDTFGGSQPNVIEVGCLVRDKFGIQTIGGYRAGDPGDHGTGRALDIMTYSDANLAYQVADYLLANQGQFGINYVITQQQINFGSGWQPMEDRGSITANHYDHVHASFY